MKPPGIWGMRRQWALQVAHLSWWKVPDDGRPDEATVLEWASHFTDAELMRWRGVGPATIRWLRGEFPLLDRPDVLRRLGRYVG